MSDPISQLALVPCHIDARNRCNCKVDSDAILLHFQGCIIMHAPQRLKHYQIWGISKCQSFPHPPTSILPYQRTTIAYTLHRSASIGYVHVLEHNRPIFWSICVQIHPLLLGEVKTYQKQIQFFPSLIGDCSRVFIIYLRVCLNSFPAWFDPLERPTLYI